MARTAKLKVLTDASVRAYHLDPKRTKPLHDGGGLYLRKRDASERWWLRMTQPGTGREQWHMLFPDDPSGGYPQKTLAMARTEAERLRSIRSDGLDPRAERIRAILTWGGMRNEGPVGSQFVLLVTWNLTFVSWNGSARGSL